MAPAEDSQHVAVDSLIHDEPVISNEETGLRWRALWRRFALKYWYFTWRYLSRDSWRHLCEGEEAKGNIYLLTWFILNIVITLGSKAMFTNLDFPYPMLLTAVHLTFTGIGSEAAATAKLYPVSSITSAKIIKLIPMSMIFTVNIWCSNYSLLVASVTLHQFLRTCIPLITMVLSLILYREKYPLRMLPAVAVVVIGVAITVWGDISMTTYGFVVVLIGCVLSSLKGLMSQKAQIDSEGLETFDLLRVICPLAVLQLAICAILSGEVNSLANQPPLNGSKLLGLISQGILAFFLNFVSFKCAKFKSPLTLNIAGNVKQVVTPFLSFWTTGGKLTLPLFIGMNVTLLGAIWYAKEAQTHKAGYQVVEKNLELTKQTSF